jgi:hypothetical protein
MLLIDGLHAFDFTFDETGLVIECMDGRQLRRWSFTPEQVAAAMARATTGNSTMPRASIV